MVHEVELNTEITKAGQFTIIDLGKIKLFYSYKQLIGFEQANAKRYVLVNYWKTTTGTPITTIIDNTTERLEEEEFKKKFNHFLKEHYLDW